MIANTTFEYILENLGEFVKIYLPILTGIATLGWGVYKYFHEKASKEYISNIENLFSQEKEIVLSAIATLSYYKDKNKFKHNIIEILLNRLYTELDVDITNALISGLSQVASKKEFNYLSQKLIDINRNFQLQTLIVEKRSVDSKLIYDEHLNDITTDWNESSELYKTDLFELLIKAKNQFKKYKILNQSTLSWHKQISAEAFAMLMTETERRKICKKLKIKLFENNFSFTHLLNFSIKKFEITYSAFHKSSLQGLIIKNLQIQNSYFEEETKIRKCEFKSGKIYHSEFVNMKFDTVTFENITFEDIFFIKVEFNNCKFKSVSGLNHELFYDCTVTNSTFEVIDKFEQKLINTATKESLLNWLKDSTRSLFGRTYIKEKMDELDLSKSSESSEIS